MLGELITDFETVETLLIYLLIAGGVLVVTLCAVNYRGRAGIPPNAAVDWVTGELLPDYQSNGFPQFHAGQLVRTRGELNYSHGSGIMVPAGAQMELINCRRTSNGWRWSAWHDGVFVAPIPEDMVEPLVRS
jgi:hypothetical protein